MQRIEQLAAIGMVIGAPDQHSSPRFCRTLGGRLFRPVAPGEEAAVADGVVAGVNVSPFHQNSNTPSGIPPWSLNSRLWLASPEPGQRTIFIGKLSGRSTRHP